MSPGLQPTDPSLLISYSLTQPSVCTVAAVMSSNGDKEAVMKCLHSGAADYLVQPLRQNELQNLWTRVWWRKVSLALLTSAVVWGM